jgi:hypothetical protein
MLLEELDIFSVPLKKFQFQEEEITPLLNEYHEKKDAIIKRSSFYIQKDSSGAEQDISDYTTDFQNPITLHEYEKLMMLIKNYFENNNYIYQLHKYWTAIYSTRGYHKEHAHNNGSQYMPPDNNFSSVLYLTSGGGTEFYSPHLLSKEYEYSIQSKVGLLVIFPSSLLHSAPSSSFNNERVVISNNMRICSK